MIEHPILFFYMPMQPPKSCKRIAFNIDQRLNKVSTKLQQRLNKDAILPRVLIIRARNK